MLPIRNIFLSYLKWFLRREFREGGMPSVGYLATDAVYLSAMFVQIDHFGEQPPQDKHVGHSRLGAF